MSIVAVPTPPPRNPHPDAKRRRAYVPTFDTARPPPRVDRAMAAVLLLARLGLRVSPRTLEGWPLPTRLVNGRATLDTAELLAYGRKLLDGSPNVRGGRARKAHP